MHGDIMLGRGGRMRQPRSESRVLANALKKLGELEQQSRGSGIDHDLRSVISDLRQLQGQVQEGYHKNPMLAIMNPPVHVRRSQDKGRVVGLISDEVHEIRYRHADDSKPYKHEFEHSGVLLFAMQDGDRRYLQIVHEDGLPLWEDFR